MILLALTINASIIASDLLSTAQQQYLSGNFDNSALNYQKYIENNPQIIEPYLELAALYREIQEYDLAIYYLNLGLANNSDHPELKKALARLLIYQDHSTDDAAIITPQTRDDFFYQGLFLLQREEFELAAANFKKACELDPRFSAGFFFLAQAQLKLDNKPSAITSLERAIAIDNSAVNIYHLLGDLYYEVGEKQKALTAYQRSSATFIDQERSEIIQKLRSDLAPPLVDPTPVPTEPVERKVDFRSITPLDDDSIPRLRVALIQTASQISFQAGSSFRIYYQDEPVFTGKDNTTYQIVATVNGLELRNIDNRPLVRIPDQFRLILTDNNKPLQLFDLEYGAGYFWAGREDRQFRGDFIITLQNNNQFSLINELSVEEYLYSVVPSEMYASWPLEALKAQAIAARSYTLRRLFNNENQSYHLIASIIHAAYKGVTWEHAASTKAVDATRGIVAQYNGEIIDAVYSANSGGHTEDAQFVWGGNVPYLKGVSVSENQEYFPFSPASFDSWIRSWQPSYALEAGLGPIAAYRWSRVIFPDEPLVTQRVGTIKSITPLRRGTAGTVLSIEVQGNQGSVVLTGDSIRSQLGGLRSSRFIVEPIFIDDFHQPAFFLIWGGGWGHNVGLDQTAAAGMASAGYDYQSILFHFYQGIELEKLY